MGMWEVEITTKRIAKIIVEAESMDEAYHVVRDGKTEFGPEEWDVSYVDDNVRVREIKNERWVNE